MSIVEAKKWFYSQQKENIPLDRSCDKVNVYRLSQTKQVICEFVIDVGLKKPVDIAQLTDLHFNYFLPEDDLDEESSLTKKHRVWLKDGQALPSALFALEGAKYSDACVITGDIMDFLSKGTMYLTKKYIFDRYPDYVCTPGGHELIKQIQTGVKDKLPIEDRIKMVADFWNTDFFYVAKPVGEKVIAVALNNSLSHYYDCQIGKLKAEIENARKDGKIILIFQHEPISTRNPLDAENYAFIQSPGNVLFEDFCDKKNLCCSKAVATETDDKIYSLITENADVIKGVFAGHWHTSHYVELNASYTLNGKKVQCSIPQLVSVGNPYYDFGFITRIIVK